MLIKFSKNILQLVIDFYFYLVGPSLNTEGAKKPIQIVAHRGWHNNENLIENTLQSFQTALDHKLYGVEFDIRWTKDLIPIVHHDESLNRLWGIDRDIADLDFLELREKAPMIPSLQEVIERFGKKLHLFIEIKAEVFPDLSKQKIILAKTLSSLKAYTDFHLLTLDIDMVKEFNNFDTKLFLLVSELEVMRMIHFVEKYELGGITGHFVLIGDELVKEQQFKQRLVGTGFLRTKSALNRERNKGVDFHFTNHPWNLI